MKQVLMIGDLLLTIWRKPKASMAAHDAAVGEATAAKPCTTPTAALSSVGSCKKMAEENTNKGETDYSSIILTSSRSAGKKEVLGKLFYETVGAKTLAILEKYRMTSLIK